jgi:hypothetical protein
VVLDKGISIFLLWIYHAASTFLFKTAYLKSPQNKFTKHRINLCLMDAIVLKDVFSVLYLEQLTIYQKYSY